VISGDLRFEGYDARSWTNLLSLFAPGVVGRIREKPVATDAPEVEPEGAVRRGSLFVIRDPAGRVLQAFHSLRGRVRDLSYDGPDTLGALGEKYGARRVVVIEEGAPEELMERVALRLERSDDYATQMLVMARAIRELIDAGRIAIWPRGASGVPVPSTAMVRRALDIVLPDEHTLVAVVWEGQKPWTGVVLRRRAGDVDLCAGPDFIARWAGPLGGDWRRDHRVIVDAVSRAVAPVHLGIFSQAETMRSLLRNPDPGAWARAAAVRDLVVSPTPPYVAVALGADAMRAAAKVSADLLGGIDALSALAPLARYVRGRIRDVTSITATLGFDPLRALAEALRRSPPDEES